MADLITFTIDGQQVQAAPGTLLINAAKQAGIEIPSFCYYEGLSLQAACRMCLVEIEKTPKLQVACTTPVAEGMVVRTDSPLVAGARKGMLELLLTNHPLDCPVCDKGGECELQDMVFRYGAGESRFLEAKHHVTSSSGRPWFSTTRRAAFCAIAASASATKAWASARWASATAAFFGDRSERRRPSGVR